MEERRPRERELVLAPNEFAWVLDTTKGHINCYVGPNKTSLAQTDQLVTFDEVTKRFVHTDLDGAVQLFATAPENWYLVLKNPAVDNAHPRVGVASGLVDLQVGKKIVVRGPASFALWPGQMARVVEAHRLRSNQYLVARVYDATLAQNSLHVDGGDGVVVGQTFVIPGNEVAFYVPPDGIEVVADIDGAFVRDAVTLQRLEYAVLVGESGRKRTVRGEAVVFPGPDERFVGVDGRRAFRAIELSETTGLHVKVTAPYVDDDGVARAEGDELFLTGATTRLYFPREEHAIVRTAAGTEVHHAVAIPAGDGRYLLNRHSGEVELVVGPRMLLADPRDHVLTRRVLGDRECALLYPGNDEALAFNRALRSPPPPIAAAPKTSATSTKGPTAATVDGIEAFSRTFSKPTALMLDTKYDGAVTVDVWSGYAVCVKNRRGERRVVVGPQTVMLAWDETLEALTLSTGTPKSSAQVLSTAFLRVSGNKVGDVVDVVSADLVEARVRLSWRVQFAGDADSWFVVDNYVKLASDRAGALLKAVARSTSIRDLRETIAPLTRSAVLGDTGVLEFSDNGMRIVDIEVHGIDVVDDNVRALLDEHQTAAVSAATALARREVEVAGRRRQEALDRLVLADEHETKRTALRLRAELDELEQALEHQRLQHRQAVQLQTAKAALQRANDDADVAAIVLSMQQRQAMATLQEHEQRQALELQALSATTEARVRSAQAVSPELAASLTRLGDTQVLSALAENFGELAAVEGRGLLETARRFLDIVPSTSLPVLRPKVDG